MDTASNYRTGHATEEAGAKTAAISAKTVKARIMDIYRSGSLTDDELDREYERLFGPPIGPRFSNTLRRRRLELKAEGLVFDTGARRTSRFNVPNIVWGLSTTQQ